MSSDILFKLEDKVFSHRVGGILIRDGKILLQKPKNDYHAIIGGHVQFFETAKETLIREYKEEIGADIEVDNMVAVSEQFFPWGERKCHQVNFYYNIHLISDTIPLDGKFHGFDDLGNERLDLDFEWVSLEELKKGLTVYPMELIPHILAPTDHIVHFVGDEYAE